MKERKSTSAKITYVSNTTVHGGKYEGAIVPDPYPPDQKHEWNLEGVTSNNEYIFWFWVREK